jgi:hypothetical protein
MVAERRDTWTTDLPHDCHAGCPKRGEASTDDQARDSFAHHPVELEATLAQMLAGRKSYAARFRPHWWWLCSPDAQLYRDNPSAFEDPRDTTPSSVKLEPWVKESIDRRRVEEVGRVRFLTRQGLLEQWEEQVILGRGGVHAKAVKEELARRTSR